MPLPALLAALAITTVQAPITAVTVYSDRARVQRTALLQLDGQRQVEFPLLDEGIDASTIQLDAAGGSVVKIDIAHVDEQDFPRTEARDLLRQLDAIDDQIATLNGASDARKQQLAALQRITPGVKLDDTYKPLPRLTGAGWAAALAFLSGEEGKLQEAVRKAHDQLFELHRERERLAVRAAQVGGARRHTGHRVRAEVSGHGAVKLTLTYRALNARWTPSYDVQFLPDKGEANVSFSGLVSQESGEDWTDALLTLSTAVPASATQLPKILSWKIGERERFIPTPAPMPPQPIPPAPPAPEPRPRADAAGDDLLRARLARVAQSAQTPADVKQEAAEEDAAEGAAAGLASSIPQMEMPANAAPSRPAKKGKSAWPHARQTPQAMAAPLPPPPAPAGAKPAEKAEAPAMDLQAEPPLQGPGQPAAAQVGLAPPPAYVPPSYDSTLPAALAGGYDLSFESARKETIKSGEGARRVPLFGETWPVTAERVLYPALAPEAAFLVAQIKNGGERILPGGPAALAVGADPAGTAQLKLVSAGETFTLPLGLDRALKAIRNVNQVLEEKGLFSKDELTHYTVTIELANPYRKELKVRIVDQLPLPANKDAELQLEKIEPRPQTNDSDTGKLEWALTLPASGKQIVSFTYSLKRPKGYRLYQEQ